MLGLEHFAPQGAGATGHRGRRHCRLGLCRARQDGHLAGGNGSGRIAVLRAPRSFPGGATLAGSPRHRPDEFRRNGGGGARLHSQGETPPPMPTVNWWRPAWPTWSAVFFHIMPAGGGTSQTAVNDGAGARSQLAGAGDRRGGHGHAAFPRPLFGHDAPCHPGRRRHDRQHRPVSPARVPRHPTHPLHGISLGTHRRGWSAAARHPEGNPGGGAGVDGGPHHLRANRYPVHVLGRKPGTNVFRPRSAGASGGRNLPRAAVAAA